MRCKVPLITFLATVLCVALTAQQSHDPKLAKGVDGTGEDERGASLYEDWIVQQKASQQVPILELRSANLLTQEALPWPAIGARGAYFRLLRNQMMDAALIESTDTPTKPHKHMYEEFIYVVRGKGTTTVQQEGRRVDTIEWNEGGFFPVPLNTVHEHRAAQGTTARLLSVTGLPFFINITGDADSVYMNTRSFTDRYDAQEDYFKTSVRTGNRRYSTNFVKDVRNFEVDQWDERGKGNRSMFWTMGGNRVLGPHISEFEPATYKNGHRTNHEAVKYIINGTGSRHVWEDFGKPKMKLDWEQGSVVLVPPFWFHQHFNTGDERARYLAITTGGPLGRIGLDTADQIMEDEPEIKEIFQRALAEQRAKKGGAKP